MTCLHHYLQHTFAYLKLKMKKKNKYIQPLIVTVILEDDAGGGLMKGSPTGEGSNFEGEGGNPTYPPFPKPGSTAKSGFFSSDDEDWENEDY